jgi:hypothetical protein
MIEKASVDKIIILNKDVALPTAGDRLFNPATAGDVLPIKGVGIYEPVPGSGSPEATTGSSTRYIEVIKRRDTTADSSPLPDRFYERSGLISLDCIHGLEWSGAKAALGTSQSVLVGAPAGEAGQIEVIDNIEYSMVIVADGYKTDQIYGHNTIPTLHITETFEEFGVSPGLTTYGSDEQARDFIIQKIVDKHNVLSSSQGDVLSVAVAIATDVSSLGGATAYNTTALTALPVGSQLTIGYNHDSTPVNLLLTTDVKNALLALLAAANAKAGVTTASIVQYALPSALNQTALGASKTAGGQGVNNARVEFFGLVAIDVEEAYYDETFSRKRNIRVGLNPDGGFGSSTYVKEASVADMGTGSGKYIKQWYKNVEHYSQYLSAKDYGAMHIAYPDDIVESGMYDVYSLYYCSNRTSNSGNPVIMPKRLIMCVPNFTVGDASTNSFYTGTANPQKAAVEAIMNTFVNRVGLPSVSLV